MGSDFSGKRLGHRRAADQGLEAAPAPGPDIGNNRLHLRQGRTQKGGDGNNLRLIFFSSSQELAPTDVHTQIYDPISATLQHHAHQVFADVVNVALDSTNDDGAFSLDVGPCQMGPENFKAGAHGLGRHEHLGYKKNARIKFPSHLIHSGN